MKDCWYKKKKIFLYGNLRLEKATLKVANTVGPHMNGQTMGAKTNEEHKSKCESENENGAC